MDSNIDLRQAAVKRIEAKRGFRMHATVYVLVNALLVIIWMMNGQEFFWPLWSIVGWGLGLAGHFWALNGDNSISEEDIRREMERGL